MDRTVENIIKNIAQKQKKYKFLCTILDTDRTGMVSTSPVTFVRLLYFIEE
jgi:hypothetical protein